MTVQLKVNVINEMKKLRTVVYGDRLAWVEELIQNTQRAEQRELILRSATTSFGLKIMVRVAQARKFYSRKAKAGGQKKLTSRIPSEKVSFQRL